MKDVNSETIFLVTGLVTAAAANRDDATLKLAHSLAEEEQYIAAIYMAEKIIEYYPNTSYANSAQKLVDVICHDYLDRTSPIT
ncbi:tetratricopeptide repeat protein [Fodinibius saliphilus]|uniref:tetratricopeptide repeat protein n=1 Tax=Fodinibius saliphilus TaxID=1920650 RepID=UPI001108CDE1|nr:hypothetical protein [Fodinibius saliphilus]